MRLRMPLRVIAKTHFHICNFLACMIFLSSVASLFSKPACAQSATPPTKSATTSPDVPGHDPFDAPGLEQKVNALLQKMTLEEKIGQLVQYSAGQATGPTSGRTDDRDMVRKGQVGSLFNVAGSKQTNALQHIAVDESRLHIPLIFGLDVIHGFRTTFPIPLGLAATWEPELVEKAARVAAQEASAAGVRW